MKPDPEVLQGKIDLIEEHLDLLEELSKRDYEDFKGFIKAILGTFTE